MDQNSTNGTGPDKRNWRERLGIGAKELPKLSEEFRAPPPMQASPPPAGTAKPAPRAPQPVTRPAPMAPRSPAKAPAPLQQTPVARPQPRVADPLAGSQDALAEKLRAQRAAAERLAEQRVQAARERAEARSAQAQQQQAPAEPVLSLPPRLPLQPSAAPPQASAPPPRAPAPLAGNGAPPPRPKFSFADEEGAPPRREMLRQESSTPPRPAPLTPPRPALGGDRGQPPFLRPSSGGSVRPPANFRSTDTAASTGYTPGSRPLGTPTRSYDSPPGYGAAARPPVRRPPPPPPALDSYARPTEPRAYGGDEFEETPRLARAPAPRTARPRPPEDSFDEVFEDEPAQPRQQRATARDYQNAYREAAPAYEDEERRSSGPWLLLLALLVAALVTAGGVWYYNTQMRTVATTAPQATDGVEAPGDGVPVVSAPDEPVKTAPEQPVDQQGQAPAAAKKKLIYDRIVGDQEITGDQVTPTEEIPIQPAAEQPLPEAASDGTAQIPAPVDPGVDTGLPATDEPAPLPLPPPPGTDQEGSLDQQGIERIAAAAAQSEQGEPVATGTSTQTSALLPPPDPVSENAPLTTGSSNAAVDDGADAPADVEEVTEEPTPVVKPAKKKAAAKKAVQQATTSDTDTAPIEPVVLVPPAQPASPSQSAGGSAAEQGAGTEPAKKKKTLFDLFRKSDETAVASNADESQVAGLTTKSKAKPVESAQAASGGGSGYVVQLSSFRSETEANSEYGRLSALYPTVVGGLPQRVAQSEVGGSTRYQLGLGPLKTRADATRVCSALFQAGERDCIVRGQ